MRKKFFDLVLTILLVASSSAHATPFTLGCSGSVKRSEVPKVGVAVEEKKENIEDMSIIVNLEQRTVSGFWSEGNIGGRQTPLPIVSIDSNGVTFEASKGTESTLQQTIRGTVDRITGKVDAMEMSISKDNAIYTNYELRCRRTRPLF